MLEEIASSWADRRDMVHVVMSSSLWVVDENCTHGSSTYCTFDLEGQLGH
jgi:hypothetical protein